MCVCVRVKNWDEDKEIFIPRKLKTDLGLKISLFFFEEKNYYCHYLITCRAVFVSKSRYTHADIVVFQVVAHTIVLARLCFAIVNIWGGGGGGGGGEREREREREGGGGSWDRMKNEIERENKTFKKN